MSLRLTSVTLGSRGSGYNNRVMVYAHRRQKSRYLAPKQPHCRSPLANKSPEEYGDNWDPRSGVDWYNRLRGRNHYRHWPWARWHDDPIRHHADTSTHRRVISALSGAAAEGLPEWDVYAAVGQDYQTPPHFPLAYAAPFIHQYTGKAWSESQLRDYLNIIAEATGLRTMEAVAANIGALRRWGEHQQTAPARGSPSSTEAAATAGRTLVPRGVLQHVELLTQDIVAQHARKTYRAEQHQSGVLRTREMERYYALPHLQGPAMPVALAQPSGAYPWGKYTYMLGHVQIHPLQAPDARLTENMYPR